MFLLLRRLSPQAKDLCGKLSANDNNILSPAVGGRKKRNVESGQCKGRIRKNKSAGLFQGKTACFPLWREAEQGDRRQSPFSAIPTKRKFFFREASHREAYEKRIWSDLQGKIRFPLCPARDRRALPLRAIHPFRENSSLGHSCFAEVVIRGARAANRSKSSIKKMTKKFFVSENS